MKKKIIALFLLVLMICIFSVAVVACESGSDSTKQPTSSEQEYTNPDHDDVELPEVNRP